MENWHILSEGEVLKHLGATPLGIGSDESQKRLAQYGLNYLPQPPKQSGLLRFVRQFHNILIYVLIISALITALMQHWVDAFVIVAVVFINALIGFVQEGKAEKAMDAIRHMLAPHANVLRHGIRMDIEAKYLVPGDVVFVEAGDKIPADLRLIEIHGLLVQEAILTGESVAVEKKLESCSLQAPLGDRRCMAFSGTSVIAGQGKGVVVGTGPNTEIGRISGLLSGIESLKTPLVEQMEKFGVWLTVFILAVSAALLFYAYQIGGYEFSEAFMIVVGLAVAAIPEGLPAVLTVTLAIGVQAMAKRNAIVRRLPAIETLGSVSVICTDKTGTLTRNEMMVASMLTSNRLFSVEGEGYKPTGNLEVNNVLIHNIGLASLLCNDASIREEAGVWLLDGDPTEGALLALAGKTGLDLKSEREHWARTDVIPFDSRYRFMAVLNHNHEHQGLISLKGAPEQVLELCHTQMDENGLSQPIDLGYWYRHIELIARKGQRVLALAVKTVPSKHTVLERSNLSSGMTLLGMVGMIDPPRAEAIEAVAECFRAGIRVKMITGDHAHTAMAIADQIGLQNSNQVITGADIDGMDDSELAEVVLECDIFARTSPEHKLRLVMALQSNGMIVAMTGDGVNDAPALKRADAGIAMGQKGSEVAKEASEFVLADDNFASIVAAVREGRTVYNNIKKVISWTLPTNAGEGLTIALAILLGFSLPVTPVQILWINLITAVTLGIALAFEKSEPGIMRVPPRLKEEGILNAELIWHICFVSVLFAAFTFGLYEYVLSSEGSVVLARTSCLNVLVFMEIFHLIYIRNMNKTSLTVHELKGGFILWSMVGLVVLAQILITCVPVFQKAFGTETLPLKYAGIVLGIGVLLFVILEIEKQLRLRLLKN